MKKTIVCMMSIMMVAVMTACGSEKTGNQKVSGGTDSITASTDAETDRDRDVQESFCVSINIILQTIKYNIRDA